MYIIKGKVKVNNKSVKYVVKEKCLTIGHGVILSYRENFLKRGSVVLFGAETPGNLDCIVKDVNLKDKAERMIFSIYNRKELSLNR